MEFKEYCEADLNGNALLLQNGKVLTTAELIKFDAERRPETEIAAHFGISRVGLWKARQRLGILRERKRCDKGKRRGPYVDPATKKRQRRRYMREYRL